MFILLGFCHRDVTAVGFLLLANHEHHRGQIPVFGLS